MANFSSEQTSMATLALLNELMKMLVDKGALANGDVETVIKSAFLDLRSSRIPAAADVLTDLYGVRQVANTPNA